MSANVIYNQMSTGQGQIKSFSTKINVKLITWLTNQVAIPYNNYIPV
jgi:hypothetical protein